MSRACRARRPPLTPELAETLERALREGVAAQRRQWARQRNLKLGLGGGVLVACAAASLALVLRAGAPLAPTLAPESAQNVLMRSAPPIGASDSAAPADAGPPRAPERGGTQRPPPR